MGLGPGDRPGSPGREGRARGGSEAAGSSGSLRLGPPVGVPVGWGWGNAVSDCATLGAPPFHCVWTSGFEVAALARPPPASPPGAGRNRQAGPCPCFVAKRLLQRLIGPRRWGDRSPLICELQRAQRFIHKSAPGAALAAPEPWGPRSRGAGRRRGGPAPCTSPPRGRPGN
ncbi:hypothetical protein HPG69_004360 [Diceros bicornis minor]|uniref:Uncharacterized protein n=1 Tax=Diceros bicornis minor TaxID=77932 RepID=A0A7J7E6W1_DICBM|nr:hypothetical protein HPG69_004360 [Diceros bicornis minor]